MSNVTGTFVIAGLTMKVTFETPGEDLGLIPSFRYFRTDEDIFNTYITIVAGHCDKHKNVSNICVEHTDNGDVLVGNISGGYRCCIYNTSGKECCILDGNNDFTQCRCELIGSRKEKSEGLRTALLIAYIQASSFRSRMVIHSSTIKKNDRAYCFLGKSGTGKSTHSSLWLKNIGGSMILNDDNPILQIDNNKITVWGSPWSGKTNYYINDSACLGALVKIKQAAKDSIEQLHGIKSLVELLPSCSCFIYSRQAYNRMLDLIGRVLDNSNMYNLYCLPDDDAALLCYKTVACHN